ncbi:MAG: hypothetical protein ACLQVI_35905 [Polyangiaceae bacterium]
MMLVDKYPAHKSRVLTSKWFRLVNGLGTTTTAAQAEAFRLNAEKSAPELCTEDAQLSDPNDPRVAKFAELRIRQENDRIEAACVSLRTYARLDDEKAIVARILIDGGNVMTSALSSSFKLTEAGRNLRNFDPLELTLKALPTPEDDGTPKVATIDINDLLKS